MINAIIFDLDGVLVHTDHFHYQAWKKTSDLNNLYFDESINNKLRGVSREESLKIILRENQVELQPKQMKEMIDIKNDIYVRLISQMTEHDVEKEVLNTLIELKNTGVRLAVGSSSKNAKIILNQTKLISIFDAVCDGTMIEHSKPAPDVFLKAASLLGVFSDECLVVEDAVSGVQAGKKAGMITIAIGDASDKKAGDINIKNFAEIIDVLGVKK